jgi:hypothetical protein
MPIVNNPFAAQPPKPTAPPPPAQGMISGAMPNQAVGYAPTTRAIDSKGTVTGQVDSILAKDGPMMERARAMAREQMNGRGLINSSMGIEAGQAAVMDRALPMAQQDAQAYNQADQDNQVAINTASQFNTAARNQYGQQGNEQRFQALQNTANNALQERMQLRQESGLNTRAAAAERGTQNRFTVEASARQREFDISQANAFKQQTIAQSNALAQMGYQSKLTTAQVPQQFAAQTAQSATDRVNMIMSDPDLKPEAKQAAVANIVAYTNSTLAWAEKFYGTPIARMSAPTGTRPATTPAAPPPPPPKQTDGSENGPWNNYGRDTGGGGGGGG